MRTAVLCLAIVPLLCACQTPVTPDPEPPASTYDVWTTPPPEVERRLERAPAASEPAARWTLDGELSVLNRYGWRGQVPTDDPVLQPSATLTDGRWRLNAWANVDLTRVHGDAWQATEVDLTFEWGERVDLGALAARVTVGAIGCFFPNLPAEPTLEAYAGLAFELPLAPSLTVYRDVALVDGSYVSLDFQEQVAIGPFPLLARVGVAWGSRGYDEGYFGVPRAAFNDLHAQLSVPWTSGPWTVKPFVGWQSMLDGAIRAATTRSDALVAGLTVGARF